MSKIPKVSALEFPDSRGNPIIMVSVALNNGVTASAKAPERSLVQ